MKLLPFLLLVFALLFVGCGKPDLDDPDKLNKILEEALDADKIQERGVKGQVLLYAPNDQKPYTGWVKSMHSNGQVELLGQIKDGKPDGLNTEWYDNGQKKQQISFKSGVPEGTWTRWYDNGQKKKESQYESGEELADSVKKWSRNGERIEALDDAVNNLKQMYLLLFEYDQNEAKYPDDLKVLPTDGYISSDSYDQISNCVINGKKTKFAYRRGFSSSSPVNVILMHTPKPIAGKMAYLSNDGSVRTVSAEDFENLLSTQK